MNHSFENFSMYGFTVDYPDKSRVEFNSKSRREAGDVVFRLPDNIRIFLTWGDLTKVKNRFASAEEHANFSLDAMQRGKNVRNFERVSRDTVPMHSHNSSLNKVKFGEKTFALFSGHKDLPRDAYSMHVHCDKSNRYFVLYSMAPADGQVRVDKIMESMQESFKCH